MLFAMNLVTAIQLKWKKKIISLFKHSVVELAVIVVLYRIWFSVWGDVRIIVVVSQQKKKPLHPSATHSDVE